MSLPRGGDGAEITASPSAGYYLTRGLWEIAMSPPVCPIDGADTISCSAASYESPPMYPDAVPLLANI
jgi:hypothetical protein